MTRPQWIRRLAPAALTMLAVALAVSAGAPPHGTVRIGLYVLGAIVVGSTVEWLVAIQDPAERGPSTYSQVARARRPALDATPETLAPLQRTVRLATDSSGGWYFRLRPRLRAITATILEDRRRLRLDRDQAVPGVLGTEAWDLLRPDAPEPEDRFTPGLPAAQLEALVRRIEEL